MYSTECALFCLLLLLLKLIRLSIQHRNAYFWYKELKPVLETQFENVQIQGLLISAKGNQHCSLFEAEYTRDTFHYSLKMNYSVEDMAIQLGGSVNMPVVPNSYLPPPCTFRSSRRRLCMEFFRDKNVVNLFGHERLQNVLNFFAIESHESIIVASLKNTKDIEIQKSFVAFLVFLIKYLK